MEIFYFIDSILTIPVIQSGVQLFGSLAHQIATIWLVTNMLRLKKGVDKPITIPEKQLNVLPVIDS